MRDKKNIIVGIGYLIAAVFVLVGSMGYLGEISVWTLLFSFLLIIWLIKGISQLEWSSILFPLAFLAILYDDVLGIEKLTPWPVLIAALLGSIGLGMIFKKKHKLRHKGEGNWDWKWNGGKGVNDIEQLEDEHKFCCDVSFGTLVKYINCQSLREVEIDNSFGKVSVYFDGAVLENGKARAVVDNSFGNVELFIPAIWSVLMNIDESFGGVRVHGNCAADSENQLLIEGDTSFGDIDIHYI